MTKYREIIRLAGLNLSQTNIALSCNASKITVNKVLKATREKKIAWPLDQKLTDDVLTKMFFPEEGKMPLYLISGWQTMTTSTKNFFEMELTKSSCGQNTWKNVVAQVLNHLCILSSAITFSWMSKNGVQLCTSIVNRQNRLKQTGLVIRRISQTRILAQYFGGVAKILVPDNCRTAVDHNKSWQDQRINAVYQERAEYYGTAVIPARIRAPRDKPNAEGCVGNISTWITVALRNEQFFSIGELNWAIRQKLDTFSRRPFQK